MAPALLAAVTFLLLSMATTSAQTNYTWTSATASGVWTTSANWTVTSGSGSTYPGGNAGDTATLGTVSSGTRIVTYGGGAGSPTATTSSLTIAGLTFTQATGSAINELQLVGGGYASNHLGTTTLTNTGGTLDLGGSGVSGEELLYLNAGQTGQNGTNTSWGSVTYGGSILLGTNGVLEMSAPSNAGAGTVTGSVEVGSGGALNLDQAISSFNGATISGGLQLDSTGTMTFGSANSGGLTAAGTDVRFNVGGVFLAKTGSTIAEAATPTSTNTYEFYFTGTSATFDSGVTGGFITNYALGSSNYESVYFTGSGSTFALASDVNLPNFLIEPTATGSGATVTVTVGTVSTSTLTLASSLYLQAPTGSSGTATPNGALVVDLSSNITAGYVQPSTKGGAGQSITINLGGYTLSSGHSEVLGNINSAATTWLLEGTTGGTFVSTSTISLDGSTGTDGTSVSGPITLLSSGTSGTNDLGNATSGATIDPTSFFDYSASSTGAESLETLNARSIGRVIVGATSGSNVSTLALAGNVTGAGDVTVNEEGIFLLNGFNYTESSVSTSNAGGLNGVSAAVVANNGGGTSTLTLDASYGAGSFAGVIEDRAAGTGTLSLALNGTGTQTISGGSNTYSGGTAVNAGTLLVTNSTGTASLGSGALTVAPGATLGGSGKANGLASVAIGSGSATQAQVLVGTGGTDSTSTLTLGAATGTITNANLTYNLSSTVASQSNQMAITTGSALAFATTASTVTLNVTGGSYIAPGTSFVLLSDSAGFGGSAFSTNGGSDAGSSTSDVITGGLSIASNPFFTANGAYAGGAYAGSYLYLTDNGTQIDVEVVPEPGTWALMLGGFGMLLFWQRQRARGSRR